MSYFLPSFFQKRILRYALSRLELLDTDALDLEKLDIGWGRNSTVELRDIGLHTEKLSTLLNLPSSLAIVSAQILYLRLTIPADLYKSGIQVDARTIRVCVDTNFEEQEPGHGTRPKHHRARSKKAATNIKADKPRSTQSHIHDPGGSPSHNSALPGNSDGDDIVQSIPTTIDLAKSFLQAEPQAEKAELQASVAHSKYLEESRSSSQDDYGQETPALGVGSNLSLPAFLANFLQGVGDRIEINIRDVEVDIVLQVDRPTESTSVSEISDRSDVITIRLAVAEIFVDGLTAIEGKSEVVGSQEAQPSITKGGKRQVMINDIEVMVISEASIFANLARSTAQSSPKNEYPSSMDKSRSQTMIFSAPDQTKKGHGSSSDLDPDVLMQNQMNLKSLDVHDPQIRSPSRASMEDQRRQLSSHRRSIRQTDEKVKKPAESTHSSEELHAHEHQPLKEIESSLEPVTQSPSSPHEPMNISSEGNYLKDDVTPPATFNLFDDNLLPTEDSQSHHLSAFESQSRSTYLCDSDNPVGVSGYSQSIGDDSSPNSEDLAESRIFSHEEASMYMSAISQASNGQADQSISASDNGISSQSKLEARMMTLANTNSSRRTPKVDDEDQSPSQTHTSKNVPGTFFEGLIDPEITNLQAQPTDKSFIHPSTIAHSATEHNDTPPQRYTGSPRESVSSSANLKSRFNIVKRVINIQNVKVMIPTGSVILEPATEARDHQTKESSQKMPGGFGQVSGFSPSATLSNESVAPALGNSQSVCVPYSVEIGDIQILGDIGLTRMIILINQQVAVHVARSRSGEHQASDASTSQNIELRLAIKRISWQFLDAVEGVFISDPYHGTPKVATEPLSIKSEALLRAEIVDLKATHNKSGHAMTTNLSIGKFSFGYSTDDIISFNSELKMRESTRDILAPVDKDIVATITQSNGSFDFDMTTLPLHATLDLRRLDETFSWFGGFSSMIGLGSSMMSTMTVVDAKSKVARSGKQIRGVHFESPASIKSPRHGPTQVQRRVTARVGGLVFDVQGTQSALRIEGTAMKVINRIEGLGLQVDRLNISGPYSEHSANPASIQVKIISLRVEYLSTPKEIDLARLVALLSPSNDQDARDDGILLDTLLRQRRQGAVVRATVESLEGTIANLSDLQYFPMLGEDLKKLSTVTKYLPEDDRPGLLALGLIKRLRIAITLNNGFGIASLGCANVEVAQVTLPSLMALGISTIELHRNETEEIVAAALPIEANSDVSRPMVMIRFIGNEMEPTAKVKLHNLRAEYHVSTVMDIMKADADNAATIIAEMVSSATTVTSYRDAKITQPSFSNRSSTSTEKSIPSSRTLTLSITMRDSIIGLNPLKSSAKGLIVLADTHLLASRPKDNEANMKLEIRKASIMVIDDVENLSSTTHQSTKEPLLEDQRSQSETLLNMGWVSIGLISAAKAIVQVDDIDSDHERAIDIELRDDLFVLESCADSTQTLLNILNGLKPPTPPSTERKYMTEVVPIEDLLASFTGDAFVTAEDPLGDNDLPLGMEEGDMVDDEVPQNLEFVSSFYNPEPDAGYDYIADSILEDEVGSSVSLSLIREIGEKNLLESFQDQARVAPGSAPLDFQEDHFDARPGIGHTIHRRTNKQDSPESSKRYKLPGSPLRIRVRDVHIIWNLFDGYDWQCTRDTISHAVEDLQLKAAERLSRKDKRRSLGNEGEQEDEESVIGDFLFNSIYIGVAANRDPRELTRQVNRNLDELISESDSYATSSSSGSPNRHSHLPRPTSRKLRLKRSRYHKMTFELKGVSADVTALPPDSGETQSLVDIRVRDLEIFDHVPTSTWKKFATYMHDAGEREIGANMIHIEIKNVKPVPNLAASEVILKATFLPLRLHVDQDALDFMTRFFEFKGDTAPTPTSKVDVPFLQRVEVNSIQVKFDFKPKRVDYAGIRSGHTTEFMNFLILDRADMVLRHVIIYGVSGFDKLGKTLNDIWMPDVKRNQLPGILAGLAPVRSLANVGGGVRDLVVVPIREYRKDGRVVRSLQKGALAFAKTTTSELVKLGAKLAIGTQTALQGAEDLLTQPASMQPDMSSGWEDAKFEDEDRKQISLYADQPVGVVQGLRGAYASLERDLLTAKDAIIALPGEILESGTASGAAKAVLRGAPTVILRPAMGVSKAVGQTLMGATNSLDPGNRRRIEDKYKRH